jgi:hypothetical protein
MNLMQMNEAIKNITDYATMQLEMTDQLIKEIGLLQLRVAELELKQNQATTLNMAIGNKIKSKHQ